MMNHAKTTPAINVTRAIENASVSPAISDIPMIGTNSAKEAPIGIAARTTI